MTEDELKIILKRNPSLRVAKSFGVSIDVKPEKTSKYGNKMENGYDSKKESKRAFELQCLEMAGVIQNLQYQVKFELQPGYTKNGKKIRPIQYIADFTYTRDGKEIIEDVKGMKTEIYKIKKKMFEYVFPNLSIYET